MKLIKFFLKAFFIISPWLFVALIVAFAYFYRDLPSLEDLNVKSDKKVVEILYSNGNKITTLGDIYDNQVNFEQIPKHLIDAVIATEDRKFFSHHGFDLIGILRASYVNFRAKKAVQGGSTITQQLAKLLYFNSSKTFKRKVQELLLAIKLEKLFSKEQIITLYLNRAYFGAGNYGIASASKYYFNKKVSDLDLKQSAMLAGLLKAPSKLAPTNNKKLAEERANQVLNNMVNAGYLNEKNFSDMSQDIEYKTDNMQRLYFVDFVANNFEDYLPKDSRDGKFFSISTTLDEKIQNISENSVSEYFEKNKKKLKNSQVAVIVMEKDGAIRAMIGGLNYQKSQFNRATNSRRQPGSIFKTFVYLQALQEGMEVTDMMEDKPVKIGNWSPENHDKKYYGQVTLKEAFAKSLNTVAVQLFQKIDKDKMLDDVIKMGIYSKIDKNDPTTALGTMEASLLELVNSFAVIASDGAGVMSYEFSTIKDHEGNSLYERQSSGLGDVIDKDSILKLKELLRAAVEEGTAQKANINSQIFGKTGTSQNAKDAWFIGSNGNYVIGVWIGSDDNSPIKNISGGTIPAEIFAKIIKNIS